MEMLDKELTHILGETEQRDVSFRSAEQNSM